MTFSHFSHVEVPGSRAFRTYRTVKCWSRGVAGAAFRTFRTRFPKRERDNLSLSPRKNTCGKCEKGTSVSEEVGR
jgi:hypothetical protein